MTAYVEFFLLIDACKLYLYTYTLYEYNTTLQYFTTCLVKFGIHHIMHGLVI